MEEQVRITKKMRQAIKTLEEKSFAPVHRKVAVRLLNLGLINVNGFVKGKGAHWTCSLQQKTLFHVLS